MSTGYLVVVEGDDDTGFSAYSPDLPGVIATGPTRPACEQLMAEAALVPSGGIPTSTGLVEDGDPVPEPTRPAAVVFLDPAAA